MSDGNIRDWTTLSKLRILLQFATDPRSSLEHLGSSPGVVGFPFELSMAAFRGLFDYNQTFGDYGMPMLTYDVFLDVVSMTSFQPYPDCMPKYNEDVITVLTPIVRVLKTLAAIQLKMLDFEGTGNVDIAKLLPPRPRQGYTKSCYASLLDVTESIWLRICHAYVDAHSFLVRELWCFDTDGYRRGHVWLDVNVEMLVPIVGNKYAGQIDNDDDEDGDYDEDHGEEEEDTSDQSELWGQEDSDLSTNPVSLVQSTLKGVHIIKIQVGAHIYSLNTEEPRVAGLQSYGHICVVFTTLEDPPYMQLVKVVGDMDYFLLLTCARNHYSAFYRHRASELEPYPLYMHLMSDPSAMADKVYEEGDMFPTPFEVHQRPTSVSCAFCGCYSPNLKQNEDSRMYCSTKCLEDMIRREHRQKKKDMLLE